MSLEITIKRLAATVSVIKPDKTSTQVKKIMGDNIVNLNFELNHLVNFRIGDYAEIFGEIYKANRMPQIEKKDTYRYEYVMQMQSTQYDLQKAQYLFYDSNNDLKEGDFSLTGTLETFLDLLITNINRISVGWVKGVVTTTGYKTLTFSKENCLSVLQKIAEEFETEYYVEGTAINLTKQANITPQTFKYGRSKGLYTITRVQPDSTDVITRLYAFGGTQNLPAGYPSDRLRLPGGYDVLIHDLTYTVTTVSGRRLYTFDWTAPGNIAITGVTIEYRKVGTSTWYSQPGTTTTPRTLYPYFPGTMISSVPGIAIGSAGFGDTLTIDMDPNMQQPAAGQMITVTGSSFAGIYTVLSSFISGSNYFVQVDKPVSNDPLTTADVKLFDTAPGDIEVRFRSEPVNAVTPSIIILLTDTDLTTPVFANSAVLPYLEKNIDLYSIIEGDYINDDIFPHRDGTVTAVDALNVYKFRDAGIDFDVNAVLLPGIAAKVNFNTGQLSGYSFEISSFNNTTKEFVLLKNKDEKTLDIPSVSFKQSIGDKYVLTEIQMPASYVETAEQALQAKAQEYLDLNSSPQFQYIIVCDPAYFRKKNIKMNIGDIVWLNDVELDVNKAIRIIGLTKSLQDEFEYQLELGETVTAGTIAKILSNQQSNSQNINNVSDTINNNALLAGTYYGTLKIEQGTLQIKDITVGAGSALVIDVDGNIFKT